MSDDVAGGFLLSGLCMCTFWAWAAIAGMQDEPETALMLGIGGIPFGIICLICYISLIIRDY